MLSCGPQAPVKGGMIVADCGLVIHPSVEELDDIALAAAQSCRAPLRETPRVALLSFSTAESAREPRGFNCISGEPEVHNVISTR